MSSSLSWSSITIIRCVIIKTNVCVCVCVFVSVCVCVCVWTCACMCVCVYVHTYTQQILSAEAFFICFLGAGIAFIKLSEQRFWYHKPCQSPLLLKLAEPAFQLVVRNSSDIAKLHITCEPPPTHTHTHTQTRNSPQWLPFVDRQTSEKHVRTFYGVAEPQKKYLRSRKRHDQIISKGS